MSIIVYYFISKFVILFQFNSRRVQELEDQVHKLNDAADKHEESKKTCQELKKVRQKLLDFI